MQKTKNMLWEWIELTNNILSKSDPCPVCLRKEGLLKQIIIQSGDPEN